MMGWTLQDLGSLGEFVGATAVVLSLLYIARQSKVANDVAKTSAFREIMYSMTAHLNLMFGAENGSLVIRGFNKYKTLPADERLRFEHLLAGLFQHVEDTWSSRNVRLATAELMENWAWFLRERLFPYPGVREWWSDYKPAYHPDLQRWVDSIMQSANHADDPYSIK